MCRNFLAQQLSRPTVLPDAWRSQAETRSTGRCRVGYPPSVAIGSLVFTLPTCHIQHSTTVVNPEDGLIPSDPLTDSNHFIPMCEAVLPSQPDMDNR